MISRFAAREIARVSRETERMFRRMASPTPATPRSNCPVSSQPTLDNASATISTQPNSLQRLSPAQMSAVSRETQHELGDGHESPGPLPRDLQATSVLIRLSQNLDPTVSTQPHSLRVRSPTRIDPVSRETKQALRISINRQPQHRSCSPAAMPSVQQVVSSYVRTSVCAALPGPKSNTRETREHGQLITHAFALPHPPHSSSTREHGAASSRFT